MTTEENLKPLTEENIHYITRKNGVKMLVRNNRDRFFYPEEWGRFYDGLTYERQKITFNFLINTGARINEARNVRVSDVDLDRKRIVLRVTKVKAKKGEKHSRPRIIPISSPFAKYLGKYIRDNKLNPTDTFGLLSTPASNLAMNKALQKANISDWYMFSIHNIRKTFEVWLMAMSIDSLKIIAHVGHSLATAAGNYISPDVFSFDEKRQMRIVLGDLYQR